MWLHWKTPAAQERSATASNSRNSDCGGLGTSKHVSGQKSFLRRAQEMEAEFGRPVSYGEVFLKTHTRPDGSFVDQKAKQVVDCYEKELQDVVEQVAADGPENSANSSEHSTQQTLTIKETNTIFLKCTETDNRGNRFGLGQLQEVANKGKRKSSHCASSGSFNKMRDQLQNARRKIEEHETENARRDMENARSDQEHKAAQSKISKFEKVMMILQEIDPRIAALLEEEEEEEPYVEPTPTPAPATEAATTPATAVGLDTTPPTSL